MIYLKEITIPDRRQEEDYLMAMRRTCYLSKYPFQVLWRKELYNFKFDDITIFSGSNGSGKSTLLNIIANKFELKRITPYNRTALYEDYLDLCHVDVFNDEYDYPFDIKNNSKIITSDDVFDYMLQLRIKNDNIEDMRRKMLDRHEEYNYGLRPHPTSIDFDKPETVTRYCQYAEMLKKTGSRYVRDNLGFDIIEHSNGENGFHYFVDAIQENCLYLLDEPENSLSAELELELAKYIAIMARYYKCQFIIATHSPFLLAIDNALIYDMDQTPIQISKWSQLSNMKLYHSFFKEHEGDFEELC